MNKVSQNYYFSNVFIPQQIKRNFDFFYSHILPNPHTFKDFLEKSYEYCNSLDLSNINESTPIFGLSVNKTAKGTNVVYIVLPFEINYMDNLFIAIVGDKENPRYFLLEKGKHYLTGTENFILGERKLLSETDNFVHVNHGPVKDKTLSAFSDAVLTILNQENI